MANQNNENSRLEDCRHYHLAVESILRESIAGKQARIDFLTELLRERNARIRALTDQIRVLRSAISGNHLDPRFWMGFPIGLFDDPWECDQPDKRQQPR
jgi:hypothetical protein